MECETYTVSSWAWDWELPLKPLRPGFPSHMSPAAHNLHQGPDHHSMSIYAMTILRQ